MNIIDMHCHVGDGCYKRLLPQQLIANMDRHSVEKAVICPVEEFITVYNRQGNDYVLQVTERYPDRLIGFATVNPWYGERATKELRRALDAGLRGVKFNSSLQGFFINDQLVYPLIEVAAEYQAPVYFHTGTPIHALPLQLGELAEDFPTVKFLMGHMGYSDFWQDVIPAAKGRPNIYLETSLSTPPTLTQAVAEIGVERIVFGSDSPYGDLELELRKLRSYPPNVRRAILGGNAADLLGLAASSERV